MNRFVPHIALSLFAAASSFAALPQSQGAAEIEATVRTARWRSEEVAVGVTWHAHRFEHLGPGAQHIHWIEVRSTTAEFVPARGSTAFARTSKIASERGAIAAINGGFFGPRGQALGLLQVDGAVLAPAIADTPWVVGMRSDNTLLFGRQESGAWEEVRHALAGKPMLLRAGRAEPRDLGGPRHPRSAIGQRANGDRILLSCDGRTTDSLGLTVGELAHVLRALGCVDALNLDGGGSTTLWIRDEPDQGVVNCPCDNKLFDHAGERAVSNALLLYARDILQCDEEDAALRFEPAQAWNRVEQDPHALYGDYVQTQTRESAVIRARFTPASTGLHAIEIAFAPSMRLLTLTHPGQATWCAERTDFAARWTRVGNMHLQAGEATELCITRYPGQAFAFDALRWVEIGDNHGRREDARDK